MRIIYKIIPCVFILAISSSTPANARFQSGVTSLLEMRHKNIVIQNWDLSCGAAALTTLLRYQHGLNVNEKEVALAMVKREEYIKNPELLRRREGFSLLDLKRYADSTGLIGNGFGRLEFDNLLSMAPVLVPVNLEGYKHFVIFRGIAKNRVLLADPAWGNRILTKDAFLSAWFEIGHLGRVGFTVKAHQQEEDQSSNQLAPNAMDFVMIQ